MQAMKKISIPIGSNVQLTEACNREDLTILSAHIMSPWVAEIQAKRAHGFNKPNTRSNVVIARYILHPGKITTA